MKNGVAGGRSDQLEAIVVVEQDVQRARQVVALDEVHAGLQRLVARRGLGQDDATVGHRLDHAQPLEVPGAAGIAVDVHEHLGAGEQRMLLGTEGEPWHAIVHGCIDAEQAQVAASIGEHRREARQLDVPAGGVAAEEAAKFISRAEFRKRFDANFIDPAFGEARDAIRQLEAIAWDGYKAGRKAPLTQKAGKGFADPAYELSVEWKATRDRLLKIDAYRKSAKSKSRVLVICGSPRNDGTCPGEMSKTYRLAEITQRTLERESVEVDLLDLSRVTNEYELKIHPCKGCVSTAMPLCHWPCSCYPNHALGQTNDWMAEIYERWTAAHGIVIVAPVHWYQSPSPLKLMIDRLVCADGGNPDPTTTDGKDPGKAKEVELKGWDYPKHLAGRAYGLVVHGDVAGTEGVRRALSDWLDWMGLIEAGDKSRLDRFVGYYKPYATSHQELDDDRDFQEEVRNVARAVAVTVKDVRAGKASLAATKLASPRPK